MDYPNPKSIKITTIVDEINWRHSAYSYLKQTYKSGMIPKQELHELRIYGGMAGFWGDKERTKNIVPPNGLCVSILHNGKSYADAKTDSHIFYHYPRTGRNGIKDSNEIAAARAILEHRVPIFVILPGISRSTSDVKLGWIVADAIEEDVFLIEYGESDPFRLGSRRVNK